MTLSTERALPDIPTQTLLISMTAPDPSNKTDPNPQAARRPPGPLDVILSVLSSFLGVQSARNRERDFEHGQPAHFIIVGIGLTILFILAIWLVVKLALRAAGA